MSYEVFARHSEAGIAREQSLILANNERKWWNACVMQDREGNATLGAACILHVLQVSRNGCASLTLLFFSQIKSTHSLGQALCSKHQIFILLQWYSDIYQANWRKLTFIFHSFADIAKAVFKNWPVD